MFDSQMNTEWASSSLLCVRFTRPPNRLSKFGGLFSAVNFTFISRMQPNPRNPLYVLILQLIIERHRQRPKRCARHCNHPGPRPILLPLPRSHTRFTFIDFITIWAV